MAEWFKALDLRSNGLSPRGFEPHFKHNGSLAQLAERSAVNRNVTGSSPV